MLPLELQPSLRERFRSYLDTRLAVYRRLPDVDAAKAELARAMAIQGEIWKEAVAASRTAGMPASQLLLPALNEKNEAASRLHMVAYAAVMAIVVYVVVDLEFPRFGLIRLSGADRFLAEVRQAMQ